MNTFANVSQSVRHLNPARTLVQHPAVRATGFLLAHVPLALLIRAVPPLAMAHALTSLALGLLWAVGGRQPQRALLAAVYVAGAEVLWRMTNAGVFWEYAKYGAALIFLIVAWRQRRQVRVAVMPLMYFALLVPATVITVTSLGFSELARQNISFNLSGPFVLATAAACLANVTATAATRRGIALGLLAPVFSIATLAAYSTVTTDRLVFVGESSFAASGGFGPNQVSAMLGLGALLCLLLLLEPGQRHIPRWILLPALVGLIAQALLTFSRGGVFGFALSSIAVVLLLIRSRRHRVALAATVALLSLTALVLLPQLGRITGGALQARFADLDTTHRDAIARADLALWRAHPLWGVGVGLSKFERSSANIGVAAHTEYTRLVAEHGSLGLVALLLLAGLAWRSYGRMRTPFHQAWAGALVVWVAFEMVHSAMRLAAIGVVFALALVHWEKNPSDSGRDQEIFRR